MVLWARSGENNSLTPEEKREVLRAGVEVARGRIPVLACPSTTAAACRYAADAAEIGVDGLMVLPAMAYRADRREAVAHSGRSRRRVRCRSCATTTRRSTALT